MHALSRDRLTIAEETRDPARSHPRARSEPLAVTGVVYALIGPVASAVVPTAELAGSTAPLALVIEAAGIVPPVVFVGVSAAALVLRRDLVEHRHCRMPTVLPAAGLVSCRLLMTQVEWQVWRLGLPFLPVASAVAGLAAWRRGRHGRRSRSAGISAAGPGTND